MLARAADTLAVGLGALAVTILVTEFDFVESYQNMTMVVAMFG